MHCPNCGKELGGTEKFCGGCGTDVSNLLNQSAPAAPAPVAAPAAPAPAAAPAAPAPAAPAPAAPAPAAPAPAPAQSAFGEAPANAGAKPAEGAAPKKKKKLVGLIIGLAAGGLVLIGGVIAGIVFILNNAKDEPKRTRKPVETEESTEPVDELATRTIMVYAIGTDLESQGSTLSADIKEMMAANPGKDVNIVLQSGGCSDFRNNYMEDGTTQRFSILNGNIKELANLGDVSMVEPETLEDFIKFGKENFPAEHYILVMWDHGGGVPLGFGQDELHDGTLTEIEMADAIKNCDIEFESIIFNACLMGSLEVAKALDPYTEYIVAAESPTWGSAYYDVGINYTNFLNYIGKDFTGDAKDYGEFIVRDYMDNIENTQQSTGFYGIDTCMSSIDTDNIDEVLNAYESFIAALSVRVFEQDGYAEYIQLRDDCGSFESTDSVDLTTLASKYINCGDKNIESAASKLINEVGNCVFTESNNSYTYAHGMTTYAPYLYPEYYDAARLTFTTLGYSDSTISFYDKFVSKELYILNAVSYAGSWYVEPADAQSISSGNLYDISDLVVDMGGYEAIQLTEGDWDVIREVSVTLAYVFKDQSDGLIHYLGTDSQYTIDSNGYIILQNPTKWVFVKQFGFVTCECLKYEVAEDGKWYKYLGAEALVNGETAYVVIAFSSDDPDGTIIGYYYADIINDVVDNTQGYEFNDDDMIVFVQEYYDIASETMGYDERGDAVTYEEALKLYNYSNVDYSDVDGYIGFDIYDVYNNDFRLSLRPGTPAYEIDAVRGDDGISTGGDYDEGSLDATYMVGLARVDDEDPVFGPADCYWIDENGNSGDGVFAAGSKKISIVFEVDKSVTEEYTYIVFYSSDSMFSDRELSSAILKTSIAPSEQNGIYGYSFEYTNSDGVAPGYYFIVVEGKVSGEKAVIAACQVES